MNGEDAVIKNLKKGEWYPFGDYDEPTEKNGWTWKQRPEEDRYLNRLYRSASDSNFSGGFQLSVCCIVGKNGAGKSTLLDLLFRIINNLAYFLLEKKSVTNVEEQNPQKGRELSEANGFDATLYFETDGNLGILKYCYGNMSYRYIEKGKAPSVYEEFKKDISPSRMHTVLNDFFYTICTNYSIHSFNEADYDSKSVLTSEDNANINGDWIRGILHKNDGYLTPVVIVPYRKDDGIINVANEENLAIQRLSVLAVLLWSQRKFLLDEYRPIRLEYKFDRDAAARYAKKFEDQLDDNLPLNGLEDSGLPVVNIPLTEAWRAYLEREKWYAKCDINVQKAVLNYVCYKSLKICLTYRSYGIMMGIRAATKDEVGKFGVEEGTLVSEATEQMMKKLVKELADDSKHTHITLKLHQCLAFLKRAYYQVENAPLHFDLADSGELIDFHDIGIDQFIEDNLKIDNRRQEKKKTRYETFDEVFLRMPPSIFKWEVKLCHKRKRNESLSLKGMSSGEKQMLQSASYLLYHIKNIENITMDNYRTPYHHINIVMDEAELYYHPEFQRQLIANMVEMMDACHINGNIIRSVNLIIATHSPFVLSDVPKSRILYLKDGEPIKRETQTFAANYHELLYNQFFINNTMGEVGMKAFQDMMCYYRDLGKMNKEQMSLYKVKKGYFHFVVDMIADNYLKNSMKAMLEEIESKVENES